MNGLPGIKRYAVNVLLALDQLGNAALAGDPDETISSRLGRLKRRNLGRIPWRRPVSKLVDWLLDRIDRNHSIDAIEHDVPTRPVYEGDQEI